MTSIEWLLEQVEHNISKTIIEQAKELHKQEIIEAVSFGDCRGRITTYLTEEQYYQETFKQK